MFVCYKQKMYQPQLADTYSYDLCVKKLSLIL